MYILYNSLKKATTFAETIAFRMYFFTILVMNQKIIMQILVNDYGNFIGSNKIDFVVKKEKKQVKDIPSIRLRNLLHEES